MKKSIEHLKDVIKALDLLEGTQAKISVKFTITEEVRLFLEELKSRDYRFSYVSIENEYNTIIVTMETKLCKFPCDTFINEQVNLE